VRTIAAQLDHRIRFRIGDVPRDADDALIDSLCIPNLERINAKKHHIYGWQEMPEEIPLYGLSGPRSDDAIIDVPRGFAFDLVEGMADFGIEFDFEDNRAKPAVFRVGGKIESREHQDPAIDAILEAQQGIYKAPPGSGKTVVILKAGRRSGTKCCIVVNTKDILEQWVNRIHEHLGDHLQVGRIGDNEFSIGPVWTIATAQTIHSRFDQLEQDGFFETFGFVCLDECHHATAETYNRIMDRFTAQTRIGASATPDKTGDFQLAQMILGPIIHTTKHEGLVEAGHLLKPTIMRVSTEFGFAFRGAKNRWSKSNYPELLTALIDSRPRNELIVKCIMREAGHHCLVLTKRHDHIDLIEAMLEQAGFPDPIYRLTGKEKSATRKGVIKLIEDFPGCVISTVADEALDVPRIDRGFLIFPQRNTGLIEQQIGRFARTHPEKKDAKVYDFADLKVTALKAQWRARRLHVYEKHNYKIVKLTEEDFA
jgi:superfamily II DNA or RNA helicase